ncbi:MAG: glycosyltransferase [Gluconacetobacter sp.]
MAAVPDISIVICTVDRRELLLKAIRSCIAQASPTGPTFEIIIVDNSAKGTTRDLRTFFQSASIPLHWVEAHPANIAVARNAGISASSGGAVAFLDDDEEAGPDWLAHLFSIMQETGADAVVGAVRPNPAVQPPSWDPDASIFGRQWDRKDGTPVFPAGPNKTRAFSIGTGNSLWRRKTCFTDQSVFDERFGLSGGEDIDLFQRLYRRGRRFVWCGSGYVYEYVPQNRMTLRHLAERSYCGGQIYAVTTIRNARSAYLAVLHLSIQGLLQSITCLFALPGAAAESLWAKKGTSPRLAMLIFKLAAAVGKITWFKRHALY